MAEEQKVTRDDMIAAIGVAKGEISDYVRREGADQQALNRCYAGLDAAAAELRNAEEQNKWEYKIVRVGWVEQHNLWQPREMLERMGNDGWELMSVHTGGEHPTGHTDYTFKRQRVASVG